MALLVKSVMRYFFLFYVKYYFVSFYYFIYFFIQFDSFTYRYEYQKSVTPTEVNVRTYIR